MNTHFNNNKLWTEEWWVDYVENEVPWQTQNQMSKEVETLATYQQIVEDLENVKDWVKAADPLRGSLWTDDYWQGLHQRVMKKLDRTTLS